ncbi:MAG: hypothetical protein Q9174_005286 [Haloplaca sp. 1 TL-2023]
MAEFELAEHLWQQFAADTKVACRSVLVINPLMSSSLGKEGVKYIAEKFKDQLQAPTVISGGGPMAYKIFPAHNPTGKVLKEVYIGEDPPKSKGKVARPPNAFIVYRQQHHAVMVAANPGLHNNQISVALGKQWQNETPEVKAAYKAMADEIKRKHLLAHPGYQYQPRKPAEKKRRMTRRKAEQSEAQETSVTEPVNSHSANSEFPETSSGNPMFEVGNDDVAEDALSVMISEHNKKLAMFTAPVPGNAPIIAPASVAYHDTTEEVFNDTAHYTNLFPFSGMYPEVHGPLTDEQQAELDAIPTSLSAMENVYDAAWEVIADAEGIRQQALETSGF